MKEKFTDYSPAFKTLAMIDVINDILEDYRSQGLVLTLRQLYYQLVSKDLIPNTERSYKNIGTIVSNARQAGLMDWDAIEDRVRVPEVPLEFENLDELVKAALSSYKLPRHQGQRSHVELWVEKDALAGVLAPIARKYHITLMVNRGYSSTSAMKESADRIRRRCDGLGVGVATVLYLGDLDPSGEDMVRDVQDRLETYANEGHRVEDGLPDEESRSDLDGYIAITVHKLALTHDQVKKFNPPPNPTKLTDSRAKDYIAKYGYSSWEVDALPPKTLRALIESVLDKLIDQSAVNKIVEQEQKDRQRLQKALETLKEST